MSSLLNESLAQHHLSHVRPIPLKDLPMCSKNVTILQQHIKEVPSCQETDKMNNAELRSASGRRKVESVRLLSPLYVKRQHPLLELVP